MKIKKGSLFLVLVILMALGLCLPTKALAQVVTVTGETVRQIVHVTVTGETVPRPAPPSVGDGVGPPTYYPEMTLFGTEARFLISGEGEILRTIEATSEDGMLTTTITKGTIALDKDGKRLKGLQAAVDESPPDPPEDAHIIGLAYDFGPAGATFDPAITLTFTYDPDALAEGVAEEDLVIAYYDEATGEWVELDCVVDTETNTVTALVSHFSKYALIARAILVPPVEKPPVEKPPVEKPPVEKPPVEKPPVEKPPVEKPPVEKPPVEKPPEEEVVPPAKPINHLLIASIIVAVMVVIGLVCFLLLRRRTV